MPKPKTEFLHIRLSPEDKRRVIRAAQSDYLDASTWARMMIMRAVEQTEERASEGRSR